MAGASTLEFAILGPLEVRAEGTVIAPGGPKGRGLLALFLLSPNEWISTDRLIEDLWAGEAPARATAVLQVHVANLRKALEPGRARGEASRRLVTRPGGYLLAVEPDELDSLRFEALVAEGREALARGDAAAARPLLGAALALWRGALLADLAHESFVALHDARFQEARIAAAEDHLEAGLALGLHQELVAELEHAVREHRLRERLWGQLMLALYRSGRQAEALRTYGEARSVLVDELGIDPGPELQALERAILAQDPDLAAPARAAVVGDRAPTRPPGALLPQPANRLVGRADDVDAVVAMLARADVRMVTLTGAGGAGKTRLAEAVAHAVVGEYRDGVAFVRLAPVAGPDLVASAIAEALGVDELPGQSVRETLMRVLSDRELLLIVDNFEHLLVSSVVLAELLAGAAGLTVLVTSRAPLRLAAEYEYEVPPLGLPALDASATVSQLEACASVELFAERARAARASFTLTAQNVRTVAEICARLDGLPLAIELAAARVRVLTPEALLDRLSDRLDLLTGGARDAPDRQRTLRATIEWSYDLLLDTERSLFAWLGAFAGGFGLVDVDAVCAGVPDGGTPTERFDLLASLIEKSLLRPAPGSDDGRFAMLETVRDFAYERLVASGDAPDAARRHLAHFLAAAQDAHDAVNGPREAESFAMLDTAAGNLRLALASAADHDAHAFERLCTALAPWWMDRSKLAEAAHWISLALGRADVEPSGELVMHAGVLASRQDDFAAAPPLLERAREAFLVAGDLVKAADCLTYLGEIAVLEGDLGRAASYAAEALELAKRSGDGASARYAAYLLGWVAEERGDLREARRRFDDDLAYAREHAVPAAAAHALVTLAELDVLEDDLDAAEQRVAQARALVSGTGNPQFRSYCHRLDGFVALGRADGPRAWKDFSAALDAAVELGRTLEATWCLGGLASAAVLLGDHRLGARLLAAAHQLRERTGAAEPLIEQRRYEPHVAAARAALGPDEFDGEWSAVRVDGVAAALRLISESAGPAA